MEAVMARLELSRHVAADPASVALLLAEPASERDPESAVVASPPRRSGVGFAARLEIGDANGRPITGEVVVEPSTDAGSQLRLTVWAPDDTADKSVERSATTFLRDLAVRARSRSLAA
jgi:hypothetical protein